MSIPTIQTSPPRQLPDATSLPEVHIASEGDVADTKVANTVVDVTKEINTDGIGVGEDLDIEDREVEVVEPPEPEQEATEVETPTEEPRAEAPKPIVQYSTQFVFSRQIDPEGTANYRAMCNRRQRAPIPHETEHKPSEDRFIKESNEAIVAIGRRIGVDMRDRLQPPEAHHFFETPDDRIAGARERFGSESPYAQHAERYDNFSGPDAGTIMTRKSSGKLDARILAHEKAHGVALLSVDVRVSDGQLYAGRRSLGYNDLQPPPRRQTPILSEVSTDIAAWEMTRLAGYVPSRSSYEVGNTLLDGMVCKIADTFGVPPLDVSDKLVLGNWTHDRTILELASATLGEQAVRTLCALPGYIDVDSALTLAEEWDVEVAVDKLRALQAKQPVRYFEWLDDLYDKR